MSNCFHSPQGKNKQSTRQPSFSYMHEIWELVGKFMKLNLNVVRCCVRFFSIQIYFHWIATWMAAEVMKIVDDAEKKWLALPTVCGVHWQRRWWWLEIYTKSHRNLLEDFGKIMCRMRLNIFEFFHTFFRCCFEFSFLPSHDRRWSPSTPVYSRLEQNDDIFTRSSKSWVTGRQV